MLTSVSLAGVFGFYAVVCCFALALVGRYPMLQRVSALVLSHLKFI
jgi:hypothetical protein